MNVINGTWALKSSDFPMVLWRSSKPALVLMGINSLNRLVSFRPMPLLSNGPVFDWCLSLRMSRYLHNAMNFCKSPTNLGNHTNKFQWYQQLLYTSTLSFFYVVWPKIRSMWLVTLYWFSFESFTVGKSTLWLNVECGQHHCIGHMGETLLTYKINHL